MIASSIEVSSVAAEDEDRRQRKQQQGEGKPRGSQRGLEFVKRGHVSDLGVRGCSREDRQLTRMDSG